MKTITKTFYVSDVDLKDISQNDHLDNCEDILLSTMQVLHYKNKIQISWQEPERKIEITESEFDAICSNYKLNGEDCEKHSLIIAIKNDIFGASDE